MCENMAPVSSQEKILVFLCQLVSADTHGLQGTEQDVTKKQAFLVNEHHAQATVDTARCQPLLVCGLGN